MTRLPIKTLLSLTAASLCFAAPLPALAQDAPAPASRTSPSPKQAWVDVDAVRRDVALARGAFAHIHPGYDRFTDAATLDAAWDAVIAAAERKGGMSAGELYLALSETLALIRCDHTKAELNPALKAQRKTAPLYLPLRWTVVDRRAVVLDAPEGSGLEGGDEILSIDGRSIGELREALHRYIPVDGWNDDVRDGQMTASLEFMGGAVDHFGALLWDVPATATLVVQTEGGARRTVALDRVDHGRWTEIAVEQTARNFKDAVTLTPVGDRAAVLSVDTFVNYRQPVDPDTILGPVFERLEAEGRDQLILDLRRNGGGSTDASQGLFSYLIDSPARMKTAQIMRTLDHSGYAEHMSTWDKRAINPNRMGFRKTAEGEYALRGLFTDDTDTIRPARSAFRGDLVVLTSRDNSSGSTNLISALRHQRPLTLVGEATGGNPMGPTAGSIFFLKLPESGFTLRLPAFRYRVNSGQVEDGVGLVPDVAAPDTVASLRAGTDPAMDAARAVVEARIAG